MSKWVIIFTVVAVAVCASGFKLDSIFARTDTETGNMYRPDTKYPCTAKEINYHIQGCSKCGPECKVQAGKTYAVYASCIPVQQLDGVVIGYEGYYNGISVIKGTKNYQPPAPFNAGEPYSYEGYLEVPSWLLPGYYSGELTMSKDGYAPYDIWGACGCTVTY